jgi:hypothetical protein
MNVDGANISDTKNSENRESINRWLSLVNSFYERHKSFFTISLKYLQCYYSEDVFYQYSLDSMFLSTINFSANYFLNSFLSPTANGPKYKIEIASIRQSPSKFLILILILSNFYSLFFPCLIIDFNLC